MATPGSVQQTISQLGQTGNWVLAFRWVGDSSTGAVPNTNAQLQGCCQGYLFSQVEIVPGSPSPTSGYSVQVNTNNGTDILNGAGTANSNPNAVSFAASPSAPPIDGTFTLVITGQSVASAKGAVFVYLEKPNTINLAALRNGGIFRPNRGGVVLVYPPPVQGGIGVAIAPNGKFISCSGTTTSCLQEAENFRYSGGFDMHIFGGDEPGVCSPGPSCGAIVYNASTTLAFNPMEGANITSGAFTLNCTSSIGSNPCLWINSLEMANFYWPGTQIVNSGTGITILVKPTRSVPLDTAFGIGVYGNVYIFTAVNIHTPASDVAAVPLIDFDTTSGPITYSNWEFDEVNSSGIGIRVKDPPAGKGFNANTIKSLFIHDQQSTNPVVSVGQTLAGGGRITLNKWDIFVGLGGNNPTGKGVSTFEQFGTYNLNVNNQNLSYGLFFETGSAGNTVTAGQIVGTNYPIANTDFSFGGDCTKNQIVAMSTAGPYMFSLTPGSSPWNYQNTTCRPISVLISGGTVSEIDINTVGPGNNVNTGQTSGVFYLRQGEAINVTYSAAPTAKAVL